MQGLTTGRIVHYNEEDASFITAKCRAAIVTQV